MPTSPRTTVALLAVFTGGAAGSLLREALPPLIPSTDLLTSTFAINVLACLIVGWLFAVRHRVHAHVMHLGAVGFCGGLSTFSSFVADIDQKLADGSYGFAVTAPTLEIVTGLLAALAGEMLGRRWVGGDAR